jgi:predicted DCC family thiol-disulfide oxidoreductase YuxK
MPIADHGDSRSVLLYDGDCAFCTSSAQLIERWVHPHAALVPWQFTDLPSLGTIRSRVEREVVWIGRDDRVDGGAQAVASLLLETGRGWAVVGMLLRLPPIRWLAWLVYVVVSRNRHRLPGGTPACVLPPAQRPAAGGRVERPGPPAQESEPPALP